MTAPTMPPGLEPAPPAAPRRPRPDRRPHPAPAGPVVRRPVPPGRIAVLGVAWVLVTVLGVFAVAYGLGPIVEQREQHRLLSAYKAEVHQAAFETQGLAGVAVPTQAVAPGKPVAILEVPRLRLQQVVVEGVGAGQTRKGPGHVPGTAGPGQPGNSTILGRRSAFGGPFGKLGSLHRGDDVLVTTTQGQTLYRVSSTASRPLASSSSPSSSSLTTITRPGAPTTTAPVRGTLQPDSVFGPSKDDRLTLVTSGSSVPGQTSKATVVVATMVGIPFAPTPQGGRIASADGRSGDSGAWPTVVLALLAYVVVAAAAVVAYQRTRLRSAYLLSAPPLVACTVLLAEAASRLLPAWT